MDHNDKKLTIVVWIGGALILAITFGKLLWVTYFSSTSADRPSQFVDLVVETIPLFLIAIGIGLFVAWLRSRE